FLVIITAIFIPSLRNYFIDRLRMSLGIFTSLSREIQGVALYHKNLVQNQRLRKEIGLIRRQLFEAEELYLENMRLRELLDFKEKSIYPLTAASVIGYDPTNLSSIIILNKGKQQGIKKDSAVITNDGLVGRIIEVGEQTSKVLLIDDINSGVAAFIQRSRQKGLVSGTLGRELILQYLPARADVQVSDLVITSGLSGLYPKGILVGKIKEIKKEKIPGEIFVIVQPSAKLSKLEEVLVVLSPLEISEP
ncbi:MAG: rod shape-determining protein MreC, partial [Candidatus Omnitrophota bacterium]